MLENSKPRLVIVDDNHDFCEILKLYLRQTGIDSITVAHDFESGKRLIQEENPQLALLDIDLKSDQNGVDLGRFIRSKYPNTRIIYFTNHFTEEFFELVKPIQPNAFLSKQLNELGVRQAVELALLQDSISLTVGDSNLSPQNCYFNKEYVFIKIGHVFKKIELKDIDYIFYASRHANIQVENMSYPLKISMRDLALTLLEPFMQIHQSYIINIDKVTQIDTLDHQVKIAGKWLPIGANFRKTLREKLFFLT